MTKTNLKETINNKIRQLIIIIKLKGKKNTKTKRISTNVIFSKKGTNNLINY